MWLNLIKIWRANDLLKQAWEQSFEMLTIDREMLMESMRVLRQSDTADFNQDIREKDKLVNKYEREVRKKVMTHCSVQQSYSLAEGMALVSIVIDIERLGDYAKNMMELAENHPTRLLGGRFEEDLKKIENAIRDSFTRSIECLKSSNAEDAMDLIKEYRWVTDTCDRNLTKIIQGDASELSQGDAAALVLYFRWLKRVYAHLRNITTSIINPFDRIGFKPKKKYLNN